MYRLSLPLIRSNRLQETDHGGRRHRNPTRFAEDPRIYSLIARFDLQDDDQDTLMKGLSTLKEVLNEHRDLSHLEPAVFLTPFLEIIRSEETTGPVTSLALSAVNKIISYGLVG